MIRFAEIGVGYDTFCSNRSRHTVLQLAAIKQSRIRFAAIEVGYGLQLAAIRGECVLQQLQ